MIDKLPDDTQLQVILMDELRPGDVVIVNTKKEMPSVDIYQEIHRQWQAVFPAQRIVLNPNGAFTIDIKRGKTVEKQERLSNGS